MKLFEKVISGAMLSLTKFCLSLLTIYEVVVTHVYLHVLYFEISKKVELLNSRFVIIKIIKTRQPI